MMMVCIERDQAESSMGLRNMVSVATKVVIQNDQCSACFTFDVSIFKKGDVAYLAFHTLVFSSVAM